MNKHSASVVGPDPDGKYWITLEADEIRASIPVKSTGVVAQVMAAFTGQPALVPPAAAATVHSDDLLADLQRAIDRAEHDPRQWREGLAAGGSIAFGDTLPFDEIGKFGHRRDALLALAAVRALPELLERIRLTQAGERAADQEVERQQGELERLRNQRSGQAEAWVAVFKTIAECIPGAFYADGKAVEQACAAIRQMAADLERWKRSERAQVEQIMFMQGEAKELRETIERLQTVIDGSQATGAARDVLMERCRQVVAEGWTLKHDDDHNSGDLAKAAAAYAMASVSQTQGYTVNRPPMLWPWDKAWWKPCDARRSLVKAGALILAEIERLDRAEAKAEARIDVIGQNGNTGEHYEPALSLGEVLAVVAPEEIAQAMAAGRDATQG